VKTAETLETLGDVILVVVLRQVFQLRLQRRRTRSASDALDIQGDLDAAVDRKRIAFIQSGPSP
jgi:hypothetical protein